MSQLWSLAARPQAQLAPSRRKSAYLILEITIYLRKRRSRPPRTPPAPPAACPGSVPCSRTAHTHTPSASVRCHNMPRQNRRPYRHRPCGPHSRRFRHRPPNARHRKRRRHSCRPLRALRPWRCRLEPLRLSRQCRRQHASPPGTRAVAISQQAAATCDRQARQRASRTSPASHTAPKALQGDTMPSRPPQDRRTPHTSPRRTV